MNNCFYKEVFNYTLEDLIGLVTKDDLDDLGIVTLLKRTYPQTSMLATELGLFNIENTDLYNRKIQDGLVVLNPTNYSKMLQILFNRFAEHYVLSVDEQMTEAKLYPAFTKWRRKFIGILTATKDKYNSLLNVYSDNISKLMDGIKTTTTEEGEHSAQRTHDGDSSRTSSGTDSKRHDGGATKSSSVTSSKSDDYDTDVSSKELENNTPTTSDVMSTIDANQFVTNLKKKSEHTDNVGTTSESSTLTENDTDSYGESGTNSTQETGTDDYTDNESGSHESSVTTENDSLTKMARIDEIQKLFQNTLMNWTNEFAGLFIEEGNL